MAGHTIMTTSTLAKQIVEPLPPLEHAEPTNSQTHIIIAEPDPELRSVYDMWLQFKRFKNIVVTYSGRSCLEEFIRIGTLILAIPCFYIQPIQGTSITDYH
jgi:hypothetical protein